MPDERVTTEQMVEFHATVAGADHEESVMVDADALAALLAEVERLRALEPLARAAVAINAYWQSANRDFEDALPVVRGLEMAVAALSADLRAALEQGD